MAMSSWIPKFISNYFSPPLPPKLGFGEPKESAKLGDSTSNSVNNPIDSVLAELKDFRDKIDKEKMSINECKAQIMLKLKENLERNKLSANVNVSAQVISGTRLQQDVARIETQIDPLIDALLKKQNTLKSPQDYIQFAEEAVVLLDKLKVQIVQFETDVIKERNSKAFLVKILQFIVSLSKLSALAPMIPASLLQITDNETFIKEQEPISSEECLIGNNLPKFKKMEEQLNLYLKHLDNELAPDKAKESESKDVNTTVANQQKTNLQKENDKTLSNGENSQPQQDNGSKDLPKEISKTVSKEPKAASQQGDDKTAIATDSLEGNKKFVSSSSMVSGLLGLKNPIKRPPPIALPGDFSPATTPPNTPDRPEDSAILENRSQLSATDTIKNPTLDSGLPHSAKNTKTLASLSSNMTKSSSDFVDKSDAKSASTLGTFAVSPLDNDSPKKREYFDPDVFGNFDEEVARIAWSP